MLRKGMMAVALGSAVGVPYVTSEWSKIKAKFVGDVSNVSATQSPSANSFATPSASAHSIGSAYQYPLALDPKQLEQTPLVDLQDALRFNVTPDWVISRWPRVTAGLPVEKLYGMRVTWISGLLYDDMAGSLTYYFTSAQKCARITFIGTTGDPRRLVALAQQRFGFHPFNAEPGVQRYEIRWNGEAHSVLQIRSASVIRSSSPSAKYEVQLSIVDPSVRY